MPIDSAGRAGHAADLLIDATGTRSTLRSAVTERMPRQFRYGAVCATIPDPGIAKARLAQRYIGAHTMVGVMPVGSILPGEPPRAAFFWSLKHQAYSAWAARFDAWRDEVTTLWPELGPSVRAFQGPDDLVLAAYHHITVPKPYRGCVALIGDSAHATSPQLGQGANHGLIDAVILADALAVSPNVEAALALYARERRRQVRFYQRASGVLTPLFQSDSRVLAWLRDRSFHRMKIVPYLKREMVRTLAGLKTGLFTSAQPEAIAGLSARSRRGA